MIKLLAIIGKSGAGKDTIFTQLRQSNCPAFTATIYTSRPKRPDEDEMLSYYTFIPKEKAEEMALNNEFISYNIFNGWYYGVTKDSFLDTCKNIIITNPKMLLDLIECGLFKIEIVEICADDATRMYRSLMRKDNPREIARRYFADEDDFSTISSIKRTRFLNQEENDWNNCVRNIQLLLDNFD